MCLLPTTSFWRSTECTARMKKRPRGVLLDILADRQGGRVSWSRGKDRQDKGWGREQSWCVAGTVIGYMAAEAGWKEFLPGLLEILESSQCKPHWGPRYGTIRGGRSVGRGRRLCCGGRCRHTRAQIPTRTRRHTGRGGACRRANRGPESHSRVAKTPCCGILAVEAQCSAFLGDPGRS